ncbi:lipase 1-like [Armigeres subalbatus]|uniref:lipase 1-like n=1 Tax=Armigeres subalbatus TaxID=124917 RepID=UPI002ECFC354
MNSSVRWFVILIVCPLIKCVLPTSNDNLFQIDDEDGTLPIPELISKYGYEVESHTVTTDDGYELTLFRIPQQQCTETTKLPVLMTHGLLGSASDFVIIGPNNSLAYLLADNGYDVWLANARGTRYSRKHTTLAKDSEQYWDFSWHEIGYYDHPAMIDYILNVTDVSKIYYIGYSQGTTSYFVMTSTRPEYNNKIALMVALAPSAFLKRIRSPVLVLLIQFFQLLMKSLPPRIGYAFLLHSPFYHVLAWLICSIEKAENICPEFVSLIVGPNPEAYHQKAMTVYLGHTPAGSSLKQIIHYAQISLSGRFQQYDYGRDENLLRYGTEKAPIYDLEQSVAPIALYYGLNDWLVHPRDVQDLAKALPQVITVEQVADEQFNHFDFILGKNVRSVLYDSVIKMIDNFNKT